MPKRKSGAQPGNTNALKSGFYSPRFTSIELGDLQTMLKADGLNNEINLMRVQTATFKMSPMERRISNLSCKLLIPSARPPPAWPIALSTRLTDTIDNFAPVNVRGGGNKSADFIPGDPNPQLQ